MRADQRTKLLEYLDLPKTTGPAKMWLTEFVDHWPYGKAPGDVYFSESADQQKISRESRRVYDPTLVAALGFVLIRPLLRRNRSRL